MSVRFVILALAALLALLALVACGGGDDSSQSSFDGRDTAITSVESFASEPDFAFEEFPAEGAFDQADLDDGAFAEEAFPDEGFAEPPAAAVEFAPSEPPLAPDVTQAVDRLVIHSGNVSISVDDVPGAVDLVRAIAESTGGFVEQLSRAGEGPDQFATLTIRVPEDQFFTALERIGALGDVRDEFVGSEDVTEQFIDLEARLRSATEEETRLIALLDLAESVSDVLIIESELGRVRSEIERFQGQLNFLSNRVELSTITVSLFPPAAPFVDPPSARLDVTVNDVDDTVAGVRALVDAAGGLIDRVILSVDGEDERAIVILRVPAAEFDTTLAALEREGDVLAKQVELGGDPPPDAEPAEEPDARIDLSLSQDDDDSDLWLIVAIAVPIGGVLLLILLGLIGARLLRRRS